MADPAPPASPTGIDAYSPAEMAARVENAGVAKARLALLPLLALAGLAGIFIAFGAMLYTMVVTGSTLGFGPTRLLGGIAFSLGLVLVIVGGAELFTGNNLIAMGWAHGKVTTRQLLRNWGWVYLGNFAGAVLAAMAFAASGLLAAGEGGVARTALEIAVAKATLPPGMAFVRGVLCNALVCLAVWLCFAARDVTGKILAIIFPISAFVALGFEHSVANMYFIPLGMLAADPVLAAEEGWRVPAALAEASGALGAGGLAANLIPVTLGNIVGGSGVVALVYYLIYLRGR